MLQSIVVIVPCPSVKVVNNDDLAESTSATFFLVHNTLSTCSISIRHNNSSGGISTTIIKHVTHFISGAKTFTIFSRFDMKKEKIESHNDYALT